MRAVCKRTILSGEGCGEAGIKHICIITCDCLTAWGLEKMICGAWILISLPPILLSFFFYTNAWILSSLTRLCCQDVFFGYTAFCYIFIHKNNTRYFPYRNKKESQHCSYQITRSGPDTGFVTLGIWKYSHYRYKYTLFWDSKIVFIRWWQCLFW